MMRSSSLAMPQYSIEAKTRKYVKGYEFLSFSRKYEKQLLHIGLNYLKAVLKKAVIRKVNF